MGATCSAALLPVNIPNLKMKNFYNLPLKQIKIDEPRLDEYSRKIFPNDDNLRKQYRNLLTHLFLLDSGQTFIDPNFDVKGSHLSKLQDYDRKQIKLCNSENKQGIAVLEQRNVEFSYLSTVFFYLSQNKDFLRKRILLNQDINKQQMYGFRLYCNGQYHNVIVDDIVPTLSDNLLYCNMHGKQIWPPLLQKAWCKQIGGYDNAKGLSPEQCFEEITGIPTYSYQISLLSQNEIYQKFINYERMGYWLCAVAFKQVDAIRPGQVFVIQKIDDNYICLSSPFTNFNYTSNKQQNKQQVQQGYLRIPFHKFRDLFEYLVVGYAKKGYVPISKKVFSQKRQQKLYEINIDNREDVSIRFTQFYSGYLDDADKPDYQYSPLVIFQLYDKKGNLLNFCQGCDRIYSGAHSTYISKHIFHSLEKDRYFLRLQVDWEIPNRVKQGNIVIYASEGNVQIEQLENLDLRQNIKRLHLTTLTTPNTTVFPGENNLYEVCYFQKKANALISVQSKSDEMLRLQLDFTDSTNFRIKYEKLQNKKVIMTLAPNQIKYIEILPEQLKKQFKIEPFVVKKLPNPIE